MKTNKLQSIQMNSFKVVLLTFGAVMLLVSQSIIAATPPDGSTSCEINHNSSADDGASAEQNTLYLPGGENMFYVSVNGFSDAVFVRLMKGQIGEALNWTQWPVKWLSRRKSAAAACKEETDDKGWHSNINLDLSAGFMQPGNVPDKSQFVAISGQINNICIMFVLILEA